jgi:fluoride ion exporter CrcB/FEX
VIHILLVGVGGFFGAAARFGLANFLLSITQKPPSFFTILAINLIGCFGIGFLNGFELQLLKPEIQLLLLEPLSFKKCTTTELRF